MKIYFRYNISTMITNRKFILTLIIFLIVGQFFWANFVARADKASPLQELDKLMHFGGGVLVVSLFFAFLEIRPLPIKISENKLAFLLFAVSFAALIGVFWEFYEYLMGLLLNLTFPEMDLADTLSDLFFDIAGGLGATLLFLLRNKTSARP